MSKYYKRVVKKTVGKQKGKYTDQGIITLHHKYIGHTVEVSIGDIKFQKEVRRRKRAKKPDGRLRVEQGYFILPNKYIGKKVVITDLDYSKVMEIE